MVVVLIICLVWYEYQIHFADVSSSSSSSAATAAPRPDRIVFLVLARDAMPALRTHTHRTIEKVKNVFPNSRAVFVENDSKDDTVEYIRKFISSTLPTELVQPDMTAFRTEVTTERSSDRIDRMAALRNICLDHVSKKRDEIVVVMDGDVYAHVNINHFVRAIDYLHAHDDVHAVSPVGIRVYFPVLFHRPFDAYSFQNTLEDKNVKKSVRFKQFYHFPIGREDEVKVASVYGGFCIYKAAHIAGKRYSKVTNSHGEVLCEHVAFNTAVGGVTWLGWFRTYFWFK